MKEAGISLIELLIVMTLSSFIVEGLFSVYLHTKEHHKNHNALQEITEEMRFVNQVLDRAIQGAGYLGMRSWEKIPVYDAIHQTLLSPAAIVLFNAQDAALAENVKKRIKPITQAIELRQMDFNVTSLTEAVSIDAAEIMVEKSASLNWKKDDCFVIADYEHAEINCISGIKSVSSHTQLIQLGMPLHNHYEKGTYLGKYLDKVYFIGDTGEKFADKQPIYGLYIYSENGITEEITELVSDIHFQWLKEKTLQISVHFTLPYRVNGKIFEHQEEFIVANRE